LRKAGQFEQGLEILEEALALVHRKGERCYLAEIYRIKGDLLLMQAIGRRRSRAATAGKASEDAEAPAVSEAEECFHQSIKIAQQQSAKSYELRASMSLARLYQNKNKHKAARDVLAQIYASFTEGFETADLREAKALLDALS